METILSLRTQVRPGSVNLSPGRSWKMICVRLSPPRPRRPKRTNRSSKAWRTMQIKCEIEWQVIRVFFVVLGSTVVLVIQAGVSFFLHRLIWLKKEDVRFTLSSVPGRYSCATTQELDPFTGEAGCRQQNRVSQREGRLVTWDEMEWYPCLQANWPSFPLNQSARSFLQPVLIDHRARDEMSTPRIRGEESWDWTPRPSAEDRGPLLSGAHLVRNSFAAKVAHRQPPWRNENFQTASQQDYFADSSHSTLTLLSKLGQRWSFLEAQELAKLTAAAKAAQAISSRSFQEFPFQLGCFLFSAWNSLFFK